MVEWKTETIGTKRKKDENEQKLQEVEKRILKMTNNTWSWHWLWLEMMMMNSNWMNEWSTN